MSLETIQLERLALTPGCRVLDLGCGEGRHSIAARFAARDARVTGLDLSAEDLAAARAKAVEFFGADRADIDWVCASGLTLPFPSGCFDIVICAEVLEHIVDFEAVLAEIRRVLKPTGHLAVSVPRFGPEWLCWRLSEGYRTEPGGHVRIFRSGQLKSAIERRGLRCYARHWAHALHTPYWWLRCLTWSRGADHPLSRAYHRMLVWDLMAAPWLTRTLDRVLNPLLGKSVVMYFEPPAGALGQDAAP